MWEGGIVYVNLDFSKKDIEVDVLNSLPLFELNHVLVARRENMVTFAKLLSSNLARAQAPIFSNTEIAPHPTLTYLSTRPNCSI